jgi:hypothetical protein
MDPAPVLSYLSLPNTYTPSPVHDPIAFLLKHLRQLPPHLLSQFTSITTPKQRTSIPVIRNRRLKHASASPSELSFDSAVHTWPTLWHGHDQRHPERRKEEEEWARTEFLAGSLKHVGKLGPLLGGYEEQREAERMRLLQRARAAQEASIPEEDTDSEEENATEEETMDEARASFERLVKERFIYGLLDVST